MLCFSLSMPGVSSWSGKWSGGSMLYAKVVNFGNGKKANEKAQKLLDTGYFSYSFGDGWRAGISVARVTPQEARKIRSKSNGFYGYDWMVDSIRLDGEIIAPSERRQTA